MPSSRCTGTSITESFVTSGGGTRGVGVLLLIAVMPFPTAIMGRYGDQTLAVVIYAAVLGTTGTPTWLIWLYAIRRRLVTPSLDRRYAGLLWQASATPLVFFLSIPLAFWQPYVAQVRWGLIRVGLVILGRRG